MTNNDIIIGSEFNYKIDTTYGLSADGYIATGTESIVYKGKKTSRDGRAMLSCVLKFKYKAIKVGADEGTDKVIDIYQRFRSHDMKIFDELQDCRSVVRLFDVIEDLGDFSVTDTHVPEGQKSISINRDRFFCVVEEYIDGWSLEEYCRDSYWKLTRTVDVGNNLKRRVPFHQFSVEQQKDLLNKYQNEYADVIRYQSEMLDFMHNLCEVLKYITDEKKILHLDIKPDNIMITRYGKELVLIDFGRSEQIDLKAGFVESDLGAADYNQEKQSFARPFQYGTLGYAAPECFVEPIKGSKFPFDDAGIRKGKMSVESDIFSFGATFWECFSIFDLYTGNQLFSSEKNDEGYGAFYQKYLLNDNAYCDRDFSLTSSHYHEKVEDIIKKCTRKRVPGYRDKSNPSYQLYYHDYNQLQEDIRAAKESAPAIVKVEDSRVRNAFGLSGIMAGLIGSILLVCLLLKLTGSYFAQRKMDTIMENYNPTLIEQLQDAAVEQLRSSTEFERHNIYTKTYTFLKDEDDILDYSETSVLVNLLKYIESEDFINDSVDTILLTVDQKRLSKCIEYTVTNLTECNSVGHELAVQIFNAQKRINLLECYSVLENYADNTGESTKYGMLIQRLAQDLNHDELITQIAEEKLLQEMGDVDKKSTEYVNKMAENKNDIKNTLEAVIKGNANEGNR